MDIILLIQLYQICLMCQTPFRIIFEFATHFNLNVNLEHRLTNPEKLISLLYSFIFKI